MLVPSINESFTVIRLHEWLAAIFPTATAAVRVLQELGTSKGRIVIQPFHDSGIMSTPSAQLSLSHPVALKTPT